MVKIIHCDIFEGEWDACGHCCNCQNTFGSGLALAIKKKFPAAYQADCETKKGDPNKLGSFSYAQVGAKYIFNLYGQFSYGTQTQQIDYSAFESSLSSVKEMILGLKRPNFRLAFPYKIGSDRAGGKWEIVLGIIEKIFNNASEIEILIYKLESVEKASRSN